MGRRIICWILLACALLPPVHGQGSGPQELVELRVSAVRPGGRVVVDRGHADGLAVGDPVRFQPREGGLRWGRVQKIEERSAIVELLDVTVVIVAGTRGQAQVPASRFAEPAPAQTEEPAAAAGAGAAAAAEEEHPPWEREADDWQPDMPLLAGLEAIRPENRPSEISGRLITYGFLTGTSTDDRTSGLLSVGADMLYENPFGKGGRFHFAGEALYDYVDVEDQVDQSDGRLILAWLSYGWGGTRFDDTSWEVGRFFQQGMPELGVLDGVEYIQRLDSGSRFGASLGYMPEPLDDFASFEDFQIAAFYEWVSDPSRLLSAAVAFQKTFHEGDSDRDLLVTRLNYLPREGWDFNGTAWIDFYGSGDDAKDQAVEVTQAWAVASNDWGDAGGMQFTYRHLAFPELLREEFWQVAPEQLAEDQNDRLAFNGWKGVGGDHEIHGHVAGWVDQDDAGADAHLGVDVADMIWDDTRTDVQVFGTRGAFSSALGARLIYTQFTRRGSWDLFYEIANLDQDGFDDDNDDIIQHRLRLSDSINTASGWSISGFVEGQLWEDEVGLLAGFFLQRSF